MDIRQWFEEMDRGVHNGVQDSAGVLRVKMRRQLEKVWAKVQKRFTNLQLAISFVDLPQTVKVESYGVWLLNDGVFKKDGKLLENRGGRVIIVVDMTRKKATLSAGYMVDQYMADGEAFQVLSAGHASLLEEDVVQAGEAILLELRRYLQKVHKRALKGKGVK